MVRALYYVIRLIPWYYGNPVFSHEIINVNTSKRALFFTNITPHKKMLEKQVFIHSFFSNEKYFNTRQIS